MANSLQEQLLKAGLVSEEQLNRSKKQDHKSKKRTGSRKHANAANAAVAQQKQRRAEKEKALNQARESDQKEKELRAQIRELVLANAQSLDGADVPFNVVKNGRIRRIYVTQTQRDQLAAGTLAVTTARGRHQVIDASTADRIQALMANYFVFRVSSDGASNDAAEDDPYAQFKVPDDLTW